MFKNPNLMCLFISVSYKGNETLLLPLNALSYHTHALASLTNHKYTLWLCSTT